MSKKYLLIILIISAIALISYFILGGFKSAEITLLPKHTIKIYGTYYEGKIGSDSLKNLFVSARKLVEGNQELESIAIAYYGDVNQDNGFVKNFVGVDASATQKLMDQNNWEYRSFEAPNSIKACIEANVLAMPTPDDMLADLRDYGANENIKTDSIFIEYYSGPNKLCVELLSL